LVLSSSGNAAISAANYCKLAGLNLNVFVSPKITEGKKKVLQELKVNLHFSDRAVSDSTKFAKENNCFNLRPSLNELGPEGYQTMAFELLQNQGIIEDIFIPVSSGVSLLGIAKGFKKFGFLPRVHVCQSAAVSPLAAKFDQDFDKEEESLAKALVARITPVQDEVIRIVKESEGSGWVITNKEILSSQQKLFEQGIETSEEGALALAAVYKARQKGFSLGKTVCLLTGKKY
jgi:threonine synthase